MKYEKILAIETSSDILSVAISKNNRVIGETIVARKNSHSEIISNCINNLLINCGIKMQDLNAVAISEGPGSYTGIRIGYSIAKGITFAMKIPLLSINTLHSMFNYVDKTHTHILNEDTILCPMIDARRMEVYTTMIKKNGEIMKKTSPVTLNDTFFENLPVNTTIIFFGNGAVKCMNILKQNKLFDFIPNINPRASFLLEYLEVISNEELEKIKNHNSPIYLKEFDTILV